MRHGFAVLHRDRVGSGGLRAELAGAHWDYMDRFGSSLLLRGPMLRGDAASGSVHVLATDDLAEARAFALDEPYYAAGVFRDVLIRRWRDGLDVPGGPPAGWDGSGHLVLGLGPDPEAVPEPAAYVDGVLSFGHLLSDDDRHCLGSLAVVGGNDADRASRVLARDAFTDVEVHRWRQGGRTR